MPSIRCPDLRRAAGLAVAAAHCLPAVAVPGSVAYALDRTQTAYLTHCGGCHGIEGVSGRTFVPALRDTVGAFTCSAEGRAYLVRVPGVSMSLIRDDALLADVMNFVIFRLGGRSTPAGVSPYTAEEIHTLRQDPVTSTDLMTLRGQILGRSLSHCPPAG